MASGFIMVGQGNQAKQPADQSYGGGGYGGSYGGSGGGGGSTGPTDEQKKAAGNLGGISGYNRETVLGGAKNSDKVYDIADQQNANLRATQTTQAKQRAGSDWYTQQQKLQSVTGQIMDASGNAMNGSSLYDLWDMVARKDDMDDVAVLDQMRQNQNTVDNNFYEALMQTNSGRNENAMKVETNLRELYADYIAQLNNIHPDLSEDKIDADGHTLEPTDWFGTSYFDQNVRPAVKTETQGLYRPDAAAADAWSQGLLAGEKNTASAANKDYRQRLYSGYQRRTQ